MKKSILSFVLLVCSYSLFSQTAGTLTVTYSTKTISNQTEYADAIYITNSSAALVNTLVYQTSNGNSSASSYLTVWWNLIGKSISTTTTKFVGATDGITGATVKSSAWVTGKNVYWGKTTSVASVPDGTYTVNFIIVEATSGGSSVQGNLKYSGTFVKGATASGSIAVTGAIGFANMSLAWAPVNTAINEVEMDKLYSVYPNPAVSSIYVSGSDVKEVEICSLAGQSLLLSNEQHVNISSLPKGHYLAVIRAKTGTVVKKIIKL